MRISIPEFLSDEHSLAVFFLVSVAMGGGAACPNSFPTSIRLPYFSW